MSRRLPRPGAGFLILAMGWIFVVGFLGWGFSRPLLDRVWELTTRMQHADFDGLTDSEVEDLEAGIARYPALGRDVLGRRPVRIMEPASQRWCPLARQHLLVSEDWRGPQVLEVSVDLVPEALPVELHLQGPGLEETLDLEAPGTVEVPVDLPAGAGPILIRVRLEPAPAAAAGPGIRFDGRVPEVTP